MCVLLLFKFFFICGKIEDFKPTEEVKKCIPKVGTECVGSENFKH